MTTRRTPGQAHARRVLCSLARTALDVCDLRAEAGLEDDDRPRMWLVALERWTRDEEPPARLAARARERCAWSGARAYDAWSDALYRVADAAEDLREHPSHATRQAAGVLDVIARVREDLVGGESNAWVREVYARHLRDVEREAVARLEQAREHDAEAWRVLGMVRP